MALSTDDMKYLGKEFEEIKTSAKGIETTLVEHIKNPCPNITKHWKNDHRDKLRKTIAVLASAVVVIGGIAAFVLWVVK